VDMFLNAIVVVATVLGSWMAFPQARHLVRTRRVDGLSAAWIGVSMAINGWWVAYATAAGLWALLPVSLLSFLLYTAMAIAYVGTVGWRALGGLATGAFGLGMVPLPFLVVGGWTVAGVAVGLSYGVQLLPAVVAACRTSQLAGVSAATWWIASAEALLWLVYGAGVRDLAVGLAGAAGVAMASIILVRLAVTGHRPSGVFARDRAVAHARAG